MNEDHAVSVYAMAKAIVPLESGWRLSDVQMKKVSLSGCKLQAVACRKDLCSVHRVTYTFEPPLSSPSEVRPRMVAIHHKVTAPKVSWLITKPGSLPIISVCSLLAYGTLVLGVDGTTEAIESSRLLNNIVAPLFGSAGFFGRIISGCFWIAVVAHVGEAFYVAYHCLKTLKLSLKSTLLWFTAISLTGWPITSEFADMLRVHQASQKEKKTP